MEVDHLMSVYTIKYLAADLYSPIYMYTLKTALV